MARTPCSYCGANPCMNGCDGPCCRGSSREEKKVCVAYPCGHMLDKFGHCDVMKCGNHYSTCDVHGHLRPNQR